MDALQQKLQLKPARIERRTQIKEARDDQPLRGPETLILNGK